MRMLKSQPKSKIISLLLLISILIQMVMPLTTLAAGLTVRFSSSATEIKAGDTISVNIYVTGGETSYFSAYLEYDESVFEKITKNSISINSKLIADEDYGLWTKTYSNSNGVQKISISESEGTSFTIPDNGLLATIKFKAIANTTTSTIKFNNIALVDVNKSDIDAGNMSIKIPESGATTYTITYNPNTTDLVENIMSSGVKVEGKNYTIASAPTRTGYTFTGWNTESNGSGTTYEAGSTYSTDANLNLYAQWKIKTATLTVNPNGGNWEGKTSTQTYTQDYQTTKTIKNPTSGPNGYIVRFNSNGGDTINQITQTKSFSKWNLSGGGQLNGTTYTFGDTAGTLTAQYIGDTITLPTPTKTGATLKGWYTEITGGERVGGAGDPYTPTSTTTLFAQWNDIQYTLTIDPKGGNWNGSTANQTVIGTYNSTTEISNPTAPNGYTVTLNDNGNITNAVQTQDFNGWTNSGTGRISGTTYTYGAGDGTLTANYTANSVTLPTPTKTGYTFAGWYTLANGGDKITSPYIPQQDITLYSQWTANKYTITFNAEQGNTSTPTKEVTYGQNYGELLTPTRDGYIFDGWYKGNTKITENDIVDITENTELTAKWLGATYTITFDAGEGATLDTQTKQVTNESTYGELPTPTKTGYTFVGWYDSNNNKIESTTTVDIKENKTLTAQWQIMKSTLTIDPNGGTWEGSKDIQNFTQDYATTKTISVPTQAPDGYTVVFDGNTGNCSTIQIIQTTTFSKWLKSNGTDLEGDTYTFGTERETLTAQYIGNNIVLPTPTKTGAKFKGWYTSATEGTKAGDAGKNYLPNENITLYAQWDEAEYTLTINPNGGELNGSSQLQTIKGVYNSTKEIGTLIAPEGYTITLNNNDGTENTSTLKQTQSFEKWTSANGIEINGTSYTFAPSDDTITASYTRNQVELTDLSRNGYTFEGWYTSANGGEKITSPYMPQQDITLYAHWTANKYTITFNPGQGNTSTTSKEVTYDQNYGNLPTPTRDGYTFDGWYNGTTKITESDKVDITENTELTAKWLGATYTITFDAGEGATLDTQTKQVTNESTYGELPTPTKTGYTFVGWYDSNNNKIESTTTVNITENKTLTAQWQIKQSKVFVNPNGGTWEGSQEIQNFTQDYGTTKTITAPTETPNGYTITFDTNGGTSTEELQQIQTTRFNKWNLIGGGGSISNDTYTFGIENGTVLAEYSGNNMKLPTVTKIGSTFKGWYTSAVEGTRRGGAGEYFAPTATETLYAQWETKEYTLTVIPNGGTWNGSVSNQTIKGTYNSTIEISNPVAPNGYTVTLNDNGKLSSIVQTQSFDGWTNSGNGTINGTTYTYGAGNGVITAKYTADNVTLPTPTKAGYTFDGWYTTQNGENKVENSYIPTNNVTLFAKWTANKYTITFNPGQGNTSTTSKEVTYDQTYGELPTPTRGGYNFDGWYNGNTKRTENDTVKITENTELVAKWIGATYTITFDAGEGATLDTQTKQVTNENAYGELPIPTKEGYTFIGWYDENNNKIESTTIANNVSDITLKAKYEINKYKVKFVNDDRTSVIQEIEVEHGKSVNFTGKTPTKSNIPAGYKSEFIGWDDKTKLQNITQDITVIAKYKLTPITYTIEYKNLQESDNSSNPATYTVEDGKIELKDLPDQENFVFAGWYTSEDEYAQETKISSIDTSKMENIVLYAQWEPEHLYLKSKVYKIGENDIDIYEENDVYLDKIEPETTLENFKKNCKTNGNITVLNEKGIELQDEEFVGTNMKIQVTRKTEKITLTAVVMGDLDGNGKVTATDLSTLNQALLKMIQLKNAEFKAVDLDDNQKLTATDLSTINNTILKNIKLTYDKSLDKKTNE